MPGLQGGPDLRGDAHHLPALPEGLPHSRRHPGHADQRSGAVDVQAVILAGGQGTRLRPLTHTRPKPIVPLLDRPFLHYQLALLRQHGITDVILSCSYRVADIRAAMGTGDAAGVRLRYVVEATPLGTAGGLRNAAALARGRLVVLNGDVLTDADLGAVLRVHAARQAGVTIGLVPVEDPTSYGLVETGADGAVRRFLEKPRPEEVTTNLVNAGIYVLEAELLGRIPADRPPRPEEVTTNLVNAGIYVLEAELLGRIPADRPVSIEREVFPAFLASGVPVFGSALGDHYWRDIGSPAAYRDAQVDLLRGRVATTVRPAGTLREGCWVGAGTRLAPGATLVAPSVIGARVRVGAGARLGPLAVVGAGARIAAGARIEGAILWEGVAVGEGAVLRDCIVGADAVIGAHVEVAPGVVLEAAAVVPDGTRAVR
ncbi:MAG: hypothetical protein DME09_18430 [Candidatus Rokuibacteriota bacterium]|nr:MAG: hypothetical protein DME09_18430 [Candidatus Rokubacteria bacterium]